MKNPKEKTKIDEFNEQPMKLVDIIKYQGDSIVSRLILNKKSGSVTLFAFDRNQSLSEHTSPYDAMVLVIDGSAEITISGKSHKLGKGEIIVMPANKPHALRAVDRFKMILTLISS
jgi:quercetin dioxygenase-like cupin family protein